MTLEPVVGRSSGELRGLCTHTTEISVTHTTEISVKSSAKADETSLNKKQGCKLDINKSLLTDFLEYFFQNIHKTALMYPNKQLIFY